MHTVRKRKLEFSVSQEFLRNSWAWGARFVAMPGQPSEVSVRSWVNAPELHTKASSRGWLPPECSTNSCIMKRSEEDKNRSHAPANGA
eukprot:5514538-Amphidinium_carterae.1